MFIDREQIIKFLHLVDTHSTKDKFKSELSLSQNDIKYHTKLIDEYRRKIENCSSRAIPDIKNYTLYGELDSIEKIRLFVELVENGAHLNKFRGRLGIQNRDSLNIHISRLGEYKDLLCIYPIQKEQQSIIIKKEEPIENAPSIKYDKIIDKCLIIIASTGSSNPYTKTKIKVKSGNKNVGEFQNFGCAADVVVRSDNGPGINFGKWNRAFVDRPNYKYYMLLHDDCFEFQPGWLSEMIKLYESDNKIGAVCHQIYGPGGFNARYGKNTDYICNNLWSVSIKDIPVIYEYLRKVFSNPLFVNVMGGEQVLISNKVMREIYSVGGIPEPPLPSLGGLYERIFSGYITSLGYKIKDCRINNNPPFKHHYIA